MLEYVFKRKRHMKREHKTFLQHAIYKSFVNTNLLNFSLQNGIYRETLIAMLQLEKLINNYVSFGTVYFVTYSVCFK